MFNKDYKIQTKRRKLDKIFSMFVNNRAVKGTSENSHNMELDKKNLRELMGKNMNRNPQRGTTKRQIRWSNSLKLEKCKQKQQWNITFLPEIWQK